MHISYIKKTQALGSLLVEDLALTDEVQMNIISTISFDVNFCRLYTLS